MRCETTSDAGAFWERASGFLLADPVVNSVLLTNVAARRDGQVVDQSPPVFAAALDEAGAVVAAAMRTPPFGVVLSAMPAEAVEPLAEAMAGACPDAGEVTAPAEAANAFAAVWARLTGGTPELERRMRVFRLESVTAPPAPGGGWRGIRPDDRDLLVAWSEAFEVEAGLGLSGTAARSIDRRLGEGTLFLWEDGAPVAFVGCTPPAGGVVRVGPVYTPPELRARGYASALVAAVSQLALDRGAAMCALATDLANPTANRIYQALGYRPVTDMTAYKFTA